VTAGVAAAQRGYSVTRRQRLALLGGLLPAMVLLAAVTLAPTLYLFVVSLTPATPTDPASLTDFSAPAQNYLGAFEDERLAD